MIYYVEDDTNIRELVIYSLNHSGLDAQGFSNASDFYKAIENEKPDLVLLDIMLPDTDGLTILKKLRDTEPFLPIIMVTAKDSDFDKIYGLDSGADDYITKPFNIMELISRIKALLRRTKNQSTVKEDSNKISCCGIVLDCNKHIVTKNDKPLTLTLKEFQLLQFFIENKDMTFDRDRLLQSVWGYDSFTETRTVDVHIKMLRQKLDDEKIIETVRGVGYKFNSQADDNFNQKTGDVK